MKCTDVGQYRKKLGRYSFLRSLSVLALLEYMIVWTNNNMALIYNCYYLIIVLSVLYFSLQSLAHRFGVRESKPEPEPEKRLLIG